MLTIGGDDTFVVTDVSMFKWQLFIGHIDLDSEIYDVHLRHATNFLWILVISDWDIVLSFSVMWWSISIALTIYSYCITIRPFVQKYTI